MEDYQSKYKRAAKRVKELKGFYDHLKVFVVINAMLYLFRSDFVHSLLPDNFPLKPEYFSWVTANVLLWGVGLLIHGLITYRHKLPFLKKWEERQIEKYMKQEEEEAKKYRR